MKQTYLIAASLLCLTTSVYAQTSDLPTPPNQIDQSEARGEVPATVEGRNPAVTYLMTQFGISEAEARERIDVQNEVIDLVENSGLESSAGFSDIWIEHEPKFEVVVAFTDNSDRKDFRNSLSPTLRKHVKVRSVKRTRVENEQIVEQIGRSLEAAAIEFDIAYKPQNGKVVVTVGNNGDAQAGRQLVPSDLRGDVEVRVSKVGKREQSTAPSGIQPGDYAEGGMTIHHSRPDRTEGQPWCTAGYSVTHGTGKPGIVTAGHCTAPLHLYINDHYVRLGSSVVPLSQSYTGKYDYGVYDVGTALADPWIRFRDYNAIPEFPDYGHFRVSGQVSRSSQRVGYTACKSGFTTGITCGRIESTYARYSGSSYGFVEVHDSNQTRLSAPGDSGGPWFYHPGSATNILALGIHTAGNGEDRGCTTYDCRSWYMPIDYINDHNSTIRLKTQ